MSFSKMVYTRSQLLDRFGAEQVGRAAVHVSGVTDLHVGYDRLHAKVQGSKVEPYVIDIAIEECNGAWNIDGVCSCAARGNCAHVVAVLLAASTGRSGAGSSRPVRESNGSTEKGVGMNAARQHGRPARPKTPIRVVDASPVPVLRLTTQAGARTARGAAAQRARRADFGTLSFDYDGIDVSPYGHATLLAAADGSVVRIARRMDAERRSIAALLDAGMTLVAAGGAALAGGAAAPAWHFADPADWTGFVRDVVPALRRGDWRIQIAPDFSFNVTRIDDRMGGSIRPAPDGWFDIEMGVLLGGREVRLEPLLAELFRRDRRWLGGGLENIADEEEFEMRAGQGERLLAAAARLKPLVRSLIDLFAAFGRDVARGRLRIDPRDVGRIAGLIATGGWQFPGDALFRERLAEGWPFREATATSRPCGLDATLRGYQREGLAWLQCLRRHGLNGVLADDMGLGKTVQTLAHLLTEKAAGRLDRPVLLVVPTTLVRNWRDEARRFAPGLSVLDLHGPLRRQRFALIGAHDLIITTYALLWRDHAALSRHEYHFLILDEAQYIKNVTSKAAGAIRALRARHRLCLTGTPVENHLGELWALFDFLMPGFLGNAREFKRNWRKPIEQDGDAARRALLRCRIRPFLLRRCKDAVAPELPAKTLIVRTIALEGEQRDFYETVRVAVSARVRAALVGQGAARGHIAVLDALLKLRQVCCDPRLVKFDGAAPVRESAKLDHLLAMLPPLVAAGHRILLFSQFAEMLALIATTLDRAGMRYVTLTGATVDRATPVEQFQRGDVPLFLVSLKAGGVGLNLTAADTVIHYDPWWNPASEAQATDRAHRLGQRQPVFVYKLIAAGTVEEKIVALQARKAALAARLLADDDAAPALFSTAELATLFAPISDGLDAPDAPDAPTNSDISV
ncbi:MAG: DEAD/DEAH box helicase [Janthinobacterium lividum]